MEMIATQDLTQTTLVHGALPAGIHPLLTSVIYEYPGLLGTAEIARLTTTLNHPRDLGVDAVLLRPGLADFSDVAAVEALGTFIGYAHDLGLQVIFRLSGALELDTSATEPFSALENHRGTFLQRARMAIDLGVDGLDFGAFVENSPTTGQADHQAFARSLRLIEAYAISQGREVPFSMLAFHRDSDLRKEQTVDNLIHAIRDDRLFYAPWQMDEILGQVIESSQVLEYTATTPQWRVSPDFRPHNPADQSWYGSAPNHHRRIAAMTMFALSLPGSFILRQGDEIGLPERLRTSALHIANEVTRLLSVNARRSSQQVTWSTDTGTVITSGIRQEPADDTADSPLLYCASFYAHTKKLLRMRKELGMGRASLATVSSPRMPTGIKAMLSGKSIVMLNTTNAPLTLPDYIRPLLISDRKHVLADTNYVPVECAVWAEVLTPTQAERLRRHEPRIEANWVID